MDDATKRFAPGAKKEDRRIARDALVECATFVQDALERVAPDAARNMKLFGR